MAEVYASRFKGVSRARNKAKPWEAGIYIGRRRKYLGQFATEEEAAQAYRSAADVIRGPNRKSQRSASTLAAYDDDRDWFEIELTQGCWAKASVQDIPVLVGLCWYFQNGCARSRNEDRQPLHMHRMALGLPPGRFPEVDHINHDTLDNRRENLRLSDRTQNNANRMKQPGSFSSHFKGVSRHRQRWAAQIKVDRKTRHLGTFDTEEEAALAYNRAAAEVWGEYAHLNVV